MASQSVRSPWQTQQNNPFVLHKTIKVTSCRVLMFMSCRLSVAKTKTRPNAASFITSKQNSSARDGKLELALVKK